MGRTNEAQSDKMTKRKILFVAPYPPPFSGPESSAKLFMESCIHEHFSVSLFDTNFRKSNTDKGKLGLSAIIIFIKFIFGLITRLIRYKPDIVYYYVTATKVGWIFKDIWLITISKLFGKKVVIHMRAGHFDYNFSRMSPVLQKIIVFVCKKVDLGLAQSPSLKKQFANIMNNSKVDYVYNMIDTNIYSPNLVTKDDLEVFFMGHLSQAKGYNDLLRAMPMVIEKYPSITFSFAGTQLEDERNVFNDYTSNKPIQFEKSKVAYDELISKGYTKNYKYLGIVDEKAKITQFNKSIIFVLPSFSEGFSMAVLEALSMGVPVVTTPVGALEDIIIDGLNGHLIPPGNPKKISEALLDLIDNKELRFGISKQNRLMVEQNFALEKVIEKYVELFNDLYKK